MNTPLKPETKPCSAPLSQPSDQNAPESQGPTTPEPLGGTVKVNGRLYQLVERIGQVAIYWARVSSNAPAAAIMYEVIVIRTAPAQKFPSGAQVPFREVYPGSNQWGTYGFTYTANSHTKPLLAARQKMQELCLRKEMNNPAQ